jgi:hypothetical protein
MTRKWNVNKGFMKNKKTIFIIGLGLLAGAGAMAQNLDTDLHSNHVHADLYNANEGSFDAFGFYGSKNKDGKADAWGMGVGVNYFFTKYFGTGADTYMDAFHYPYLVNGQGIFRYPIPNTGIAPYAFGGGGRQWQHSAQWLADAGVGIEYRIQPNVGAFFDAREVFADKTKDYAVLRFGFRYAFK